MSNNRGQDASSAYFEVLLLEHMSMIRNQTSQQTRLITSFMDNMNNTTGNTRRLIQGYMDNINIRDRHRENPFSFGNTNRINTQSNATTYVSPTRDHTWANTSRWPNRRVPYTRPSGYLPARRPHNQHTTRQRSNLLNQILENTLYTSISRRPASSVDISRNVSNHLWREITNTTQTLCPITQEEFVYDDRVSRIDYCGHLFIEEALHTYLSEFDDRCPVCRHNITIPPGNFSSTFDISRSPINAVRTLQRMQRFSDPSYNTQPELEPEHVLPSTFGFGTTRFNTTVDELTNAMVSSLTTAINNPDNSGNVISAEYSIFVPVMTNNSTSTEEDDLIL